ncbi:hypothetical protein CWB99_22815 [Pseudoalteromonas rubra]|uniref:Uncharacterized protein n=1 Tax=Pseudoalteromonas rubra TaxID=43658 RepID=A0A5S3WG46_9GAMM|nr:hypothetical protein [Pseudoalteromonas rubra]TMP24034.1 hypothetical protein CWB99_22815 [Pseudoalteromonas rubra]TMP35925.1 hypothetical protein CWC00_03360 [Pseudoalteromonas rubra]
MKKWLSLCLLLPCFAYADWHSGRIEMIAIGYDGKTISIGMEGTTKTDCKCYPTWPNRFCLDRNRTSFNEEFSLLLSAKAQGKAVALQIDETTCIVNAMYER